jgi:hypothetical protein
MRPQATSSGKKTKKVEPDLGGAKKAQNQKESNTQGELS